MADANQRKCGRISQKVQARGCSGSTPVGLTKTAKHLSRRNVRDNFYAIDAVWLMAIMLSHEHGFYLLICFHIALKILEIHAGISALFALSENKSAKLKLLRTFNALVECSLVL